MKSKKAVSAASYPSRIFEDYQLLNDSGCLVVCPKLSINVAANSKNKETTTSLFFSRRQRSKVIARVTRKSLRTFPDNTRAYLALAGGCDHAGQPADFAPGGRKKSGLQAETPRNRGGWSHLPLVAYVMSRPDVKRHLMVFLSIKRNSYGK